MRTGSQFIIFLPIYLLSQSGCEIPNLAPGGNFSLSPLPIPSSVPSPSPKPSSGVVKGFGNGNSAPVTFSQGLNIQTSISVQLDGKIIHVGGTNSGGDGDNGSELEIARFNSDGTLDSSFGSNGIATADYGTNSYLDGSAIQSDGKIVATGYSYNQDSIVIRFNSDGTVDPSFSVVDINQNNSEGFISPVIQPDGKILALMYQGVIYRFNADGTSDTSFGTSGRSSAYASSFALQSNGQIVACGSTREYQSEYWSNPFTTVMRLNSDGSADSTFGDSGTEPADIFGAFPCMAIALQSDGKILVGGDIWYGNTGNPITLTLNSFYIARFNTDGSLDSSFATNGVYISSFQNSPDGSGGYGNMTSLLVLPNGNIFGVGGYGPIELTANGTPVQSFQNPLGRIGLLPGAALAPSGEIFIDGYREIYKLAP